MTVKEIKQIIMCYEIKKERITDIAKRFSLTDSQVYRIVNYLAWKHI